MIKEGLIGFTGASRRLEYKGKFNGADVYDDYGHHPTEIKATADSILKKKFNSSWVIFEAHTYSRVKEHLSSFAESLMNFDHVIVVNKLKEDNVDAIYISDYDEIVDYLRKHVKENDIILTLGAGNVTKIAKKLIEDK